MPLAKTDDEMSQNVFELRPSNLVSLLVMMSRSPD